MNYILNEFLLTKIILGFFLFLIINYFGSKSKGFGYVNFADIIGQHNSFGFNFFFRILTPAIFISFCSIILYLSGLNSFVKDIYLVPIFYFVIQSLYITFNQYWGLINKKLFLITHITGFIISYWFYVASLVKGLDFILPDSGNFRTEIWFIVILYLYKILNDYRPTSNMESLRSEAITKKFRELEQEFSQYLKKEILENENLYKLFFSIMIVEDLNRNKLFRFFERIFFNFGIIKTTGIMQVRNIAPLSDLESIEVAQDIILKLVEKYRIQIKDDDDLIRFVATGYNGKTYTDQVNEVYHEISFPTDKYPRHG